MGFLVTVNIGFELAALLLGFDIPEDDKVVIGHSMVAFISKKDSSYEVFLPAAVWHDAATTKGASIQETWPWWKVTDEFHKKMMDLARQEVENRTGLSNTERISLFYELRMKAFYLAMLAEKYGAPLYEGRLL